MAEGGQGDSSHADDNTFCQPCQGEGEIKEGHGYCQNCQEYMCQHCIRIVHRSSNLKGHTILSGEQMPLIPPERDDHGSAEEYSEMCKVHANETLKFFCPDHGAFECGVCIVLDHRACSVQFVPDVAKGFSNTSEYRDQINMLREIQNDIQTCEDKVEEKSVSANDVHLVGLGDLKKFRKKINEYLDESERNIESFAEHLKAEVDEKIRELKKKYVQLKGIGDKSEQTLEIASSDEVRLYMTSKRSKKDIEGLKLSVDKIKKTCQQDNMRYEFKPDSVFEKMLSLQRNLGKMTITNEIQDDKVITQQMSLISMNLIKSVHSVILLHLIKCPV
ncbi:transcription intermediary factor 1-alpha-like [Mya arenaria]|uniref:transcription intermediary factor 1-alpha-like n=1 Tax=Mya arenaria TaxID=6604 RepID=UPI0022E95FAB|nr:transcription intermediary factor 1-alpha-like [Mya arenaria]